MGMRCAGGGFLCAGVERHSTSRSRHACGGTVDASGGSAGSLRSSVIYSCALDV